MNTPDTPADGPHEIRDAIRRLLPHGSFDLAAVRGHGIPGVNANTRDGRAALVIRCRCMRRREWPADEPLPMDILLWWLIDHDDEMFLTPRELEAKYAARMAQSPVTLDPFGRPLAYGVPGGALGLPPQQTQRAAQRHAGAPATPETGAEPRQAGNGPQDPATAAGLEYLPGHPGKLAQRPEWLDKPERQRTAEEIQTYRLDHCGTCRDAEFYGWSGTAAERAHAAHLETVDVGPLKDTPCRCPKCVKSAQPPVCPGCGMPETNCCCG